MANLKTALDYINVGLSVISVSVRTKKPLAAWKDFQSRLPTAAELKSSVPQADGLAIVCGTISGSLEMLDFDLKAELYPAWARLVEEMAPGLLARPVIEQSQNRGKHVSYRCPGMTIPGNDVFAQRPVDVGEDVKRLLLDGGANLEDEASVKRALTSLKVNFGGKSYQPRLVNGKFIIAITLIESRGEGGYFLVHPTPGYELIQGDFLHIPVITPEERQVLINAATALNEYVDTSKVEGFGYRLTKETRRPGDDFNERGDVTEVLARHGWEPIGARGPYQHYRRPGKDRGQSASLIDGRWFHVFTSNGAPFESERTYSPFAVYAHLECEGDFIKAAGKLVKLGYGDKPTPVVTATAADKTYLPVPPPFPIEVFPAACQRAIAEIQRAHGVPLEIPGSAFLGTAGGCIGRGRGLRIKQGWIEHSNLWLAIVARSGLGKSPAVSEIQRPIFALESRWFAEHREALEKYNLELELRRLTPRADKVTLPPPPSAPEWQQLIVDDATTEALTDALSANPRGILWNRDELSGLIADLDRYARKEGGAKARLMSSYDSGPWKVNRREASKRAFIRHATLSIFGTIQPEALPTIFSGLDAATGFLPRFIFVSATSEAPPLWTDETVSTGTRDYLASIFERLLALNLDDQGDPVIISVDREAKVFYENWFNEQALETWQKVGASVYEAVLAKLRGQCLRIALILHCLEAADAGRPDTSPVSPETMEKATTLANCFKAHQRNAWQSIVNQDKVAELPPLHRQVARAILSLEQEIVGGMLATARITEQVNQGLDPKFHVSPDTVGHTATVFKLTTDKLPDRSGRGFRIKPEDLHRLKSLFSSKICVPSVPSDYDPGNIRVFGEKVSAPEVSQVTGGDDVSGHLGHLPDTCKNPAHPHEHSTSDTSDTPIYAEEELLAGRVL